MLFNQYKKKYQKAIVSGMSMSPTIQQKDNIYYLKINQEYKIGEIIVFAVKNKLVVHRIIKIINNTVIAKGDNEFFEDPIIFKKNILGKVFYIKRKKQIFDFTTKKAKIYNYYCLIYSLLLTFSYKILFWIFKNIFRGRKYFLRNLKIY